MKKKVSFLALLVNILFYGQTLVIKDFETKKELKNVIIIDSETKREIDKSQYAFSKKIIVRKELFNDLEIEVSQINQPEIYLIPKSTEIEEVVIRKNYEIYGNPAKKAVTGKLNELKEYESVCGNLVEFPSKQRIHSFDFYIYDIIKKSDLRFVIYELSEGKLGNKIYNQKIDEYDKGWNEIFPDQEIILPKGKYYVGIQYTAEESADDVFTYDTSKGKRYFRGPLIGLSKNKVHSIFFGKERNYNFDKYNFMLYLKTYRIEK